MRRWFLAALVLALLAPLLVAADEPAPEPLAVVGVVDTGINPYHMRFRDDSPRAYQHPSTYIPGYPEDAQALELTLDASSYQKAVITDRHVWESVEPDELYWIPGTRIVGAKTDGSYGGQIVDTDGHGTMTASRVAAGSVDDPEAPEVYGACPDCLIVALQGLSEDHVLWAGQTGWIDAQTNSWGPLPVEGWSDREFSEKVETAAQAHPTFFATGNGILAIAGVLGNPTITQNELTPSVIGVGGHDSGYVNTWPDFPPHVVSDSCGAWGAEAESLDGEGPDVAGGTSGASPFAAGMAAHMLLEARRMLGDTTPGIVDGVVASGVAPTDTGPLADGVLTLTEWRELILKTATERPEAQYEDAEPCEPNVGTGVLYMPLPIQWTEVPSEYPEYLHIGYGAVDDPAFALAVDVLSGVAELPDRSETDEFFAADDTARQAMYDHVWTGP